MGYCGQWTLEISVIEPVVIYPWIECCQIFYHAIKGEVTNYKGKYQNARDIMGSKIFQELIYE